MHVIIVGDVVGSRQVQADKWLPVLSRALRQYTKKFDIFRGDSFQAELSLEGCFAFVFYLKARLRSIGPLDIRIGIGVGEIDYQDDSIKNSNGQAFVFSGEAFDALGKDLIAVRSPWTEYDEPVNIMLDLAMELSGKWTVNMAESVATAIENPQANQKELAEILKRKHQSQVSTLLNKAHFAQISKVVDYCTKELIKRC